MRDPVTLYPLTPTESVIRMVDHSRGVVSWVRPTMQLKQASFRGTTWEQTKLLLVFVRVTFEAGIIFENDSCDDRGGRDYRSKLR